METLSQIKMLILETFSCITYIRNFFSEECFTKGFPKLLKNENTTLLLKLLEKGIFDAIDKKYLKSFTILIFVDGLVVESYSFNINYCKSIGNLKKFCLALQKLRPPPLEKSMNIKLTYTDDTPIDYQPFGFKDGSYFKYSFKDKISVLKFDNIVSGVVPVNIEYVSDDLNNVSIINDVCKNQNNLNTTKNKKSSKINKKESIGNLDLKTNVLSTPDKTLQNVDFTKNNQNISENDSIQQSTFDFTSQIVNQTQVDKHEEIQETKKDPIKDLTQTDKIEQDNKKPTIKCLCLVEEQNFDLIYCDCCKNWLHTVCCGYFSNTDKRIPTGEYKCAFCTGEMCQDLHKTALIRKLLAILYLEKFISKRYLSSRMGISYNRMDIIFNRLAKEKFIKKKGKSFEVIKSDYTKNALKKYFKIRKTSVCIDEIKGKK